MKDGLSYGIRKLLGTIPTLLGVALIVFVLFNMVGGDPVYRILGKHATAQQIDEVRREYGFDQPLWRQFYEYLKQIATLDFGRSYATRQSVSSMVMSGLVPSLSLTLPALIVTTLLGAGVGLVSARFKDGWLDRLIVLACLVGISIPLLAYILIGQYFFAYSLGWFPISGYERSWPEGMQYLALPLIIFVLVTLGFDVQYYRAAMIVEIAKNHVVAARARGLKEGSLLLRHVLVNSAGPIITNVITELPALILGAFLLESFFGIPGLGGVTLDAIHNSDFPVIRTMALVQAFLLVLANVLADFCYRAVDPRVRLE